MKHITYSFSDSDIDAMLFALSLFPSLGLEKTVLQASINSQCCLSAREKLIQRRADITPNEFRIIYASLQAAQLINQGIIESDAKTKKECSQHLFSINKLVSVFSGHS